MQYFRFILFVITLIIFTACNSQDVTKQPGKSKNIQGRQDTLILINKYLLKDDLEHIKNYIERHNWKMQMTETGLWYGIYEKGTDEQAVKGQIAKIKFTIELLDGTLCYSSDKAGLKEFKLGQGNVESGLEEGLLLLHKGDKAHFIMPPHIAHGLIGDQNKIPARAVIVYTVELVDLMKIK